MGVKVHCRSKHFRCKIILQQIIITARTFLFAQFYSTASLLCRARRSLLRYQPDPFRSAASIAFSMQYAEGRISSTP